MPRKKTKKDLQRLTKSNEKKWGGHIKRNSIKEVARVQIQAISLSEISIFYFKIFCKFAVKQNKF